MAGYRIISSDNHVFEPTDLWTNRIEPKFKDRAPQTGREGDWDWWYCDGVKVIGVFPGTQTGMRFEDPDKLLRMDTLDNVRPGGYLPEEHIKDMDADGVDVSIVYPTVGLLLYCTVQDGDLLTAIFKSYNDWLAEFCNAIPQRIKGIGMLNVDDVQVGVRELDRCAKMGLRGAMIPVYPPEGRAYESPEYEPLWAAAQDLDMPLGLHAATNRGAVFSPESTNLPELINIDHWIRMSLAQMILSGVFERYPKLQIGSVEMELAWIPHFLERMDYAYTQRPRDPSWYRLKEGTLPSEYFHSNVFVGFQEDSMGIRDRQAIGVDNLMWGSDYPHIESTFPKSQEILEQILADCTEEEKAKIAGGNAARVYKLD